MSYTKIKKDELKELIKESIREMIADEEIEDLNFGNMIKEGDTGDYISKDEIVGILDKIE